MNPVRPIGTMITYGYPRISLTGELDLAERIGASVLEILPDWAAYPDPRQVRRSVSDAGLTVHSVHACWGGQTIKASRVDLGSTDLSTARESIDDLKRCVDWLEEAGGTFLVVHPGGLSHPEEFDNRRSVLARNLCTLADRASNGNTVICVENMPPGVWPGSRMADLKAILDEIDHPRLALALDTGHAHLSSTLSEETQAAGAWLASTHVHDNDGRRDQHAPPGRGTVEWSTWKGALDAIGYQGPILLECIRTLRENPQSIDEQLLRILARLTSNDPVS